MGGERGGEEASNEVRRVLCVVAACLGWEGLVGRLLVDMK